MGHEFVGTIHSAGPAVHAFSVGDEVVAPFTVSWYSPPPPHPQPLPPFPPPPHPTPFPHRRTDWAKSNTCFYCKAGFSARCAHSLLFGSPELDGGQAEYVRVPFADGTLMRAPDASVLADRRTLVLTADIFPTGFYGARNAFESLVSFCIGSTAWDTLVWNCSFLDFCSGGVSFREGPETQKMLPTYLPNQPTPPFPFCNAPSRLSEVVVISD